MTQLTLRDLATNMIGDSDNAATNVLIDRLGMAKINAMLDGIGLPKTRLQRKMIDLAAARAGRENVATVDETVALLAALHHGKVLGAEETTDFFTVLGDPEVEPAAGDVARRSPRGNQDWHPRRRGDGGRDPLSPEAAVRDRDHDDLRAGHGQGGAGHERDRPGGVAPLRADRGIVGSREGPPSRVIGPDKPRIFKS